MKIAAIFPGQGSQSVGMGKAFYENISLARELFEKADSTLGFSLSKLCFDGPLEKLTLTKYTQPALLCAGVVAFEAAKIPTVAMAGHSLGEYTALVCAGSLTFEDALMLVHKRGIYMQEAVPEGQGTMVAIMGPTEDEILDVIQSLQTEEIVEIANLNSPGQTVVAGSITGIEVFSDAIKSTGAKVIPLKVSAPFHCSLMKLAAEKLGPDLDNTTFAKPRVPVYANVTAASVETGEDARELLKAQVCKTVRWTDSMIAMAKNHNIQHSIEFGNGSVLCKLQKRIDKDVKALAVFDPDSLAKVQDAIA